MRIGIVGVGVVGGAVRYGMEKLGHDVRVHDPRLGTRLADVVESEVVYVCVPTPSAPDGSCDTSIVREVVGDLAAIRYRGVVALKSTVEPGTTDSLAKLYPKLTLAFVPEFLRERHAVTDFVENHDVLVVGAYDADAAQLVIRSHGNLPRQIVVTRPTAAEFCKLFNNAYNATLVVFANAFAEICGACGESYAEVKAAMVQRDHIVDRYLDCNDRFRGFAGMCLPKDLRALAALRTSMLGDGGFFQALLKENARHPATVPDGMRLG